MTTSDETIRQAAEDVLVAHQRQGPDRCLCGWSELGRSHPGHQVQMLREAGLLRQEMTEETSRPDRFRLRRRFVTAWEEIAWTPEAPDES